MCAHHRDVPSPLCTDQNHQVLSCQKDGIKKKLGEKLNKCICRITLKQMQAI